MTALAIGSPSTDEAVAIGSGKPRPRAAWMTVALAVVAMLVVGLRGLNRGSMWRDESATFDASQRGLGQLLAMLGHVDAVHGAYYLLMHFWMELGSGEVWMRVPSVLAMAVAAGLVAALGARLLRPRVGLAAGLLFAVTPWVSFYAQEGRSYAMVTAAALLATYSLVRAVEAVDHRRWWAAYAAAAVSSALLHEFAVLLLLAHAVTLLLSRVARQVWVRWAAAAGVCCVVLAPLAFFSQGQSEQVSWLKRPGWEAVWGLVRSFAGPVVGVVAVVLVLAVAGAVPQSGRVEQAGRLRLSAVAVPLAVLPPAVLLLASQIQPMYHERYVLFSLAGVPLLAAAGLERIGALLPGAAVPWVLGGAAVAAVLVVQLPEQQAERTVTSRADDLAGAAQAVRVGARPGDGVVFLTPNYRAVKLVYPVAFRGVDDVALQKSPVRAANLRGDERSLRRTRLAILAKDRVWLVGKKSLRAGDNRGAKNKKDTLLDSFRAVTTVHVHGVDVRLYVKN